MKVALVLFVVLAAALVWHCQAKDPPRSARSREVVTRVTPGLKKALEAKGLRFGAPVYMRVFKESRELELWVESAAGPFKLFKTYPIANYSGTLGPKLKEGDRQAPEGFYFVPPSMMNPSSSYHLSFNLGYPNAYDRAHDRTGSYLMIHGSWVSIGCYAMTDAKIEEIYTLAEAALRQGQRFFRVHCFPFRMKAERLAKLNAKEKEWAAFWQNLKEGYDLFEKTKRPPDVTVRDKRYHFRTDAPES